MDDGMFDKLVAGLFAQWTEDQNTIEYLLGHEGHSEEVHDNLKVAYRFIRAATNAIGEIEEL